MRDLFGDQTPCIDHDHADGRVGGILCHRCNLGISFLNDCVTCLESAIEYLGGRGKQRRRKNGGDATADLFEWSVMSRRY
jgi:hypothetical protein